jgi:DNA-binding MarR family transcriptional regulator
MNKKQAAAGAHLLPAEIAGFESWISVVRAYMLCDKALTAKLAPLGLSVAQHDILANVQRDPGMSQSTLAKRLLVTRSNVSMLLAHMIKQGWIDRRTSPADARANQLHLTSKGESLARQSASAQAIVVRLMLTQASAAETKTITSVMTRIAIALQVELGR